MRHRTDDSHTGNAPPKRHEDLACKADVLRAILLHESSGRPLNHAAVMREHPALHIAILRSFGTWDRAMRAAGIDPDCVRRHRRWSREAIVRRIQQLSLEGKPLNSRSVQLTEATLISAAWRWFCSWSEALSAAGIDPSLWYRRVPTWTCNRIVETIRIIHARGDPVSHAALRRNSVTRAAKIHFGNWDEALRAAGLDPAMIRRRAPWTRDQIVEEIRRKALAGEPLNAKDVAPHSLRSRGTHFFGSWDGALVASGLDPSKVRKSTSRGNRHNH